MTALTFDYRLKEHSNAIYRIPFEFRPFLSYIAMASSSRKPSRAKKLVKAEEEEIVDFEQTGSALKHLLTPREA